MAWTLKRESGRDMAATAAAAAAVGFSVWGGTAQAVSWELGAGSGWCGGVASCLQRGLVARAAAEKPANHGGDGERRISHRIKVRRAMLRPQRPTTPVCSHGPSDAHSPRLCRLSVGAVPRAPSVARDRPRHRHRRRPPRRAAIPLEHADMLQQCRQGQEERAQLLPRDAQARAAARETERET